jgi:hypothetical protein
MSESWKFSCDDYAKYICLQIIHQFRRLYLRRTLELRDVEDILINMGMLEATAFLHGSWLFFAYAFVLSSSQKAHMAVSL